LKDPLWGWNSQVPDSYWQFVYCARRVLGMGGWEGDIMDNAANYGGLLKKLLKGLLALHPLGLRD
jgi:hypothetical protein